MNPILQTSILLFNGVNIVVLIIMVRKLMYNNFMQKIYRQAFDEKVAKMAEEKND